MNYSEYVIIILGILLIFQQTNSHTDCLTLSEQEFLGSTPIKDIVKKATPF